MITTLSMKSSIHGGVGEDAVALIEHGGRAMGSVSWDWSYANFADEDLEESGL